MVYIFYLPLSKKTLDLETLDSQYLYIGNRIFSIRDRSSFTRNSLVSYNKVILYFQFMCILLLFANDSVKTEANCEASRN